MAEAVGAAALRIPSDPRRFREARRWLLERASEARLPSRLTHDLAVALSEACANVHRHAYGGRREGTIRIAFACDEERVTVTLGHDGRAFEPGAYVAPDLSRPHESGYGVYLMSRLVDEVRHDRDLDGPCVVLIKRRAASRRSA